MNKNQLISTATYNFLQETYSYLSPTALAMIAEDFLRENAEAETPGYVFDVDQFDTELYEYAREGVLDFLVAIPESTARVTLIARGYLRSYSSEEEAEEAYKNSDYEVTGMFGFNDAWWVVDEHYAAVDFQGGIVNRLAVNAAAHANEGKPWYILPGIDTGFVGADRKRYSSFWAVK